MQASGGGVLLGKRLPGMVGLSPIYGPRHGSRQNNTTGQVLTTTLLHVTRGYLFQAISVVVIALTQGVGV